MYPLVLNNLMSNGRESNTMETQLETKPPQAQEPQGRAVAPAAGNPVSGASAGQVEAVSEQEATIAKSLGGTITRVKAKVCLSGALPNASTAHDYSADLLQGLDVKDFVSQMNENIQAANDGCMDGLVGMLTAQAGALNAMFNHFARRASTATQMPHLDAYTRLAMKAQSQCRSTVEAIAEIKFPKRATFIKQANIARRQQVNNAHQQQVNNGAGAESGPREKNITPSNKLLEAQHGERLDGGAPGAAGGKDSHLEAVGAVNGAKD